MSVLPSARTVAIPVEFLTALHSAIQDPRSSPGLGDSVRDAGYHAGEALFDGFGVWLELRGESTPRMLTDDRFGPLLSDFLETAGWGRITLSPLSTTVIALDAAVWSEAQGAGTGCLVSTGLFAGFFGRLAEAPIAVLEVQCRTFGHQHCRFLLGSPKAIGHVHEAMVRGGPYEISVMKA